MKISHKIVMVSAAALMAVSPVLGASQATTVQAVTTSKKAKTNSGTVTIVLGHNAYIYLESGKRNTNYKYQNKLWPVIGKGASLKSAGLKTINGVDYYDIGGGNYIKAANVATVDGKKVNHKSTPAKDDNTKTIKLTHNAYVYNNKGVRIKSAGTLKKGTTIKYTGTKKIKGKKYFALANNQFVKTANAKVTSDESVQDDTTMINIIKNSIVYDGNGQAYDPQQKIIKGAQYVALKAKNIDGKWYYMIGNSEDGEQWIKAVNTTLASGKALIPEDELPNNNDTTSDDQDDTIATLGQDTVTYTANGKATTNSFESGHRVRVTELRYIWEADKNQAELFYKLASDKNGYIKQSVVATISGKPLNAVNTSEEARLSGVVATDNDKAPLSAAIAEANNVKASDSYKLATKSARDAYDSAITNAQTMFGAKTATLLDVNNAQAAVTKAKSALNGAKVRVGNLSSLTASEADQIIALVANVNGVTASQVQFSNGNANLTVTSNNGFVQTLNVSDYATAN